MHPSISFCAHINFNLPLSLILHHDPKENQDTKNNKFFLSN